MQGGGERGGGVCTAPVGSAMAVLIPMRRPLLSSSTPPELPGLMAASVWITLRMGTPLAPVCKDIPLSAMQLSVGSCSLHSKWASFDSTQATQATDYAQQTHLLQTHSLQTHLLQTHLLQTRVVQIKGLRPQCSGTQGKTTSLTFWSRLPGKLTAFVEAAGRQRQSRCDLGC